MMRVVAWASVLEPAVVSLGDGNKHKIALVACAKRRFIDANTVVQSDAPGIHHNAPC
jgi:hypothetical protein